MIPLIPQQASSAAHRSLDGAVMTDRACWPQQTADDLAPIIGRLAESGG